MDIQHKLNQQGLRLTQPRRVIMEILEASGVPLLPQTIQQRANEAGHKISLVTVYRTLELLIELKLVRRIHGQDGCHGYILSSPGHHHHIICQKCGRALEFSGADDIKKLLDRIERDTKFKIESHLLQLQGVCPDCQKGKNHEA